MSAQAPTRPIMRYHGGKWRLAPWIIEHLPPHRVYVEAFGGAASVLVRKPRSYAEVYNDLDGEIVNLFRVLRDPVSAEELEHLLRLTPFARDEFRQSYERAENPIEQARRTVFRSMAGFGSAAACGHQTGFRANSNRSNTTPARDWLNYPCLIKSFTERMAGVVIENKPAAEVIAQHDGEETLHYLDPPYPLGTRTLKGHYDHAYRHEMAGSEHAELLTMLQEVDGMVVLSTYPSKLYREILSGWRCLERDSFADGALKRRECLYLNPAAERVLHVAPGGLFDGVS